MHQQERAHVGLSSGLLGLEPVSLGVHWRADAVHLFVSLPCLAQQLASPCSGLGRLLGPQAG